METTICWPFSAAAAVEAYGHQDNNKPGNIVDGLISGLTEDREQMIGSGRITGIHQSTE